MSKTYLQCPFAEKDEAKSLGARWDPAKKRWYVQAGTDLGPFSRWLPGGRGAAAGAGAATAAGEGKPPRTGPAQLQPHCGCNVLPWEPCVHTAPAAGN